MMVNTPSLPRRTETGGGTIDRREQRVANVLTAPGAVGAQQLNLRAAHLVEGLQAAR
jgi:hypothetical protein